MRWLHGDWSYDTRFPPQKVTYIVERWVYPARGIEISILTNGDLVLEFPEGSYAFRSVDVIDSTNGKRRVYLVESPGEDLLTKYSAELDLLPNDAWEKIGPKMVSSWRKEDIELGKTELLLRDCVERNLSYTELPRLTEVLPENPDTTPDDPEKPPLDRTFLSALERFRRLSENDKKKT